MQRHATKWLSLIALAILLPAAPAAAETKTEKELSELAKSIKKWLDGQDESTVGLQPFSSADAIPANGGPGLCLTLRLELERAGVKVKGSAKFTVTGKYRAAMHRKSRRNMLYLQVKLVDRDGRPQLDLNRGIFGEQALLETVAPTVALVPGASEEDREAAVARRIEKPAAHLSGTRVSATKESLYSVEVLVKKGPRDYQPLEPRLVDGLAYVPLKRDDVYAVRLTNRSKHEAAATLLIDGLHVFSFSENRRKDGKPALSPFLVPAGRSVVVRGWPITLKRSDEFLVTGYSRSAVAELRGDKSKLGVITAQFAAAWPKDQKPPEDEKGRTTYVTGRGAPIETPFSTVQRDFGDCRAQVSVRYSR
jgi:hypothetical protein